MEKILAKVAEEGATGHGEIRKQPLSNPEQIQPYSACKGDGGGRECGCLFQQC